MKTPEQSKKELDRIIQNVSNYWANPSNSFLPWIAIFLLTFGFMGFVWSIPFPRLEFLGKYNGFVNWASFIIAFGIYYYYRISPLLSYGILLLIFAFSAGIVTLEKLHVNQGWPSLRIICLLIFVVGMVLQLMGAKKGSTRSFSDHLQVLLNGPLWLMHRLFKKLKLFPN